MLSFKSIGKQMRVRLSGLGAPSSLPGKLRGCQFAGRFRIVLLDTKWFMFSPFPGNPHPWQATCLPTASVLGSFQAQLSNASRRLPATFQARGAARMKYNRSPLRSEIDYLYTDTAACEQGHLATKQYPFTASTCAMPQEPHFWWLWRYFVAFH